MQEYRLTCLAATLSDLRAPAHLHFTDRVNVQFTTTNEVKLCLFNHRKHPICNRLSSPSLTANIISEIVSGGYSLSSWSPARVAIFSVFILYS